MRGMVPAIKMSRKGKSNSISRSMAKTASAVSKSLSIEELTPHFEAVTKSKLPEMNQQVVKAQTKVASVLPVIQRQQQSAEQSLSVVQAQLVAAQHRGTSTVADEGATQSLVTQALNAISPNKLLDAVKFGHTMWTLQAGFRDLTINAIAAIGTPGCLSGPNIEASILSSPDISTATGIGAEICHGVAKGVADCFAEWQQAVTVPGLPWYPAFAAWPGPEAPPMPNVPMPLLSCVSSKIHKIISSSPLEEAMYLAMPDALQTQEVRNFLTGLAAQIAIFFMTWTASQQVMTVMGKGRVPTFAPPYVPVGPVINGSTLPGVHLIS